MRRISTHAHSMYIHSRLDAGAEAAALLSLCGVLSLCMSEVSASRDVLCTVSSVVDRSLSFLTSINTHPHRHILVVQSTNNTQTKIKQ